MKKLLTLLVMLALIAGVSTAKPKKEKIQDPRLLLVQKLYKNIKEDQLVTKGMGMATAHRALQGFNIEEDGTLWLIQPGNVAKGRKGFTKVHESYIVRKAQGQKRQKMTLRYFGGCSNATLEKAEDGDYIWIGSNGDKWLEKNHYLRTRTVSRVKFEPDTEEGCKYDQGYTGETYYLGGKTHRYCSVALDKENDLILFSYQIAGAVTFSVYNYSAVRALPETEVKMKTTWKGENLDEEPETVVRSIMVKDVTTLEPLSTFTIDKADPKTGNQVKDVNYYNMRGYDIDKDYIYFVEGKHNNGDIAKNGYSRAYITVFNHAGEVVMPKKAIAVIADKMLLENLEIVPNDYADIAGIRVSEGKIHIAFSAYNKEGKKKGFRAVVVKYEM